MSKRNLKIILLLILFLFPIFKINALSTNAGFVPANIWYSKDPFEEGDKIKIYTLIFNPDGRQLSGMLVFFDKDTLLGTKNFTLAGGSTKDISVNWTVDVGNHNIFAKIQNAKFLLANGKYEDANLVEDKTQESSRTVTKKISINTTNSNTSTNNGGVLEDDTVNNIKKIIGENTPEFITIPIIATTNAVEKFREDVGAMSSDKKSQIQEEIKVLNTASKTDDPYTIDPTSSKPKVNNNVILKPFKYLELFFLSLVSFILNNPIVFYVTMSALIFLIFRYIWYLIF